MEIHHHPHTEKKGFKGYFLEFLMLFLAVTLGFFAESLREHVVEKRREKEYMKEIVENLKYDTLRCALNAQTNIGICAGLDSLRQELKVAIQGKTNGNTLYYLALNYLGNIGHAVFNTSAITELKNSGSLRLIQNKNLVEDISDYYERNIFAAQQFLPSTFQIDALQQSTNKFFSLLPLDDYIHSFDSISKKTYDNSYNYQNILKHSPALSLLNKDSKELELFYTEVVQHEIRIKQYNFWLSYCKAAAEKIIADIQHGYHLQ